MSRKIHIPQYWQQPDNLFSTLINLPNLYIKTNFLKALYYEALRAEEILEAINILIVRTFAVIENLYKP